MKPLFMQGVENEIACMAGRSSLFNTGKPLQYLSGERTGARRSARKLAIPAEFGRFHELQAVQPAVLLSERHQFFMRAFFHDPAVDQHDDPVRTADGREPMRDYERGAIFYQPFERLLYLAFGVGIER